MNELQTIRFYEDELQVIGDTYDNALVPMRPLCVALGLDESAQRQRLRRAPWAVAVLTTAPGADGKQYEQFCLSAETVPMWLATVQTSRIKPELRQKIERYQRECARVLANHFLKRNPPHPTPNLDQLADLVFEKLVTRLPSPRALADEVAARLAPTKPRTKKASMPSPKQGRLTLTTTASFADLDSFLENAAKTDPASPAAEFHRAIMQVRERRKTRHT